MTELTTTSPQSDYGISIAGMPMGLAIMFNDKLFERVKQLAGYMSRAEGITPPHLIGKSEACFAVITRSITWKLDPWAVMQSTYQTPGGRVGFEGKLIQAILENSGKLVGPVTYEHFGDWDKINGKFELKRGSTGKEYPAPTWTREHAKGVGVIVSAQVQGELERRTLKVNLDEMFPLNSTLWATRPSQQICYTACRAFANIAAPGLLMGEPFDVDRNAADGMRDITPTRPVRSDFDTKPASASTAATDTVTDVADPQTGELPPKENPVPDFSAADAYQLGHECRAKGGVVGDCPKQMAPEHQEAWRAGFKAADDEKSGGGP